MRSDATLLSSLAVDPTSAHRVHAHIQVRRIIYSYTYDYTYDSCHRYVIIQATRIRALHNYARHTSYMATCAVPLLRDSAARPRPGVLKGGFSKRGLATYVLKTSQIAKPPFYKTPLCELPMGACLEAELLGSRPRRGAADAHFGADARKGRRGP